MATQRIAVPALAVQFPQQPSPQVVPATQPHSLYGGAVQLEFDARSHTYTVTDLRGTRTVPSVTQALSIIDKSGALTQWAANMTAEYIRAAIRPGLSYDEVQLGEIIEQARFNFRSVSRGAKTIGQIAHEWIEAHLRAHISGTPELSLPVNDQARAACQAAAAWIAAHFSARGGHMEHRIFSREHDYAGTIDVFGQVDGCPAIVDWKASSAIYREFRLQTAAYAQAWAEMHDERPPDRWVIRLDKETGEFEAAHFPREEFRADLRAFLAAKALYTRLECVSRNARPSAGKRRSPRTSVKTAAPTPIPAAAPRAAAATISPKVLARANSTRPRDRKIMFQRQNGSLILTGATFTIKDTLKQSLRATPRKNGDAWEWEAPAACFDALSGLCQRAGIRLVAAAASA